MEMPCHCVIGDQYLPLQGGERKITCDHAEYVIKGEPVHGMKFSIVSMERTDGEENDDQGASEGCGCGLYQFRHTVGDHAMLDRPREGQ